MSALPLPMSAREGCVMGMTLDGSLTGPESSHDVGVGVATGATTAPTTRGLDPAVYDELKRIARHHLRTRASAATISTTDLLHEAWLKVGGPADPRWRDRAHFFGSASRAMRQLLVDYARHRHAAKRGGGAAPVTLTDAESALAVQLDDLIALDDALEQLRGVSERLCRVVELRFFAGLEEEEVAEVLGVTSRTVRRDWTKARLLLAEALGTE